jgi:hypothetical protein
MGAGRLFMVKFVTAQSAGGCEKYHGKLAPYFKWKQSVREDLFE